MTEFQGSIIAGIFDPELDPISPWHKRSKAKNKTNFRLNIKKASQSRYKTFSDIAAEKQYYHCTPHWQVYIHIATEIQMKNGRYYEYS